MTTGTEPRRAVTLMLKDKRLGFADLARPRSVSGGKPSYGARLIIEPNDPDVKAIDVAVEEVAAAKWKDKAPTILGMLVEKDRVAFSRKPYRNKEGETYSSFEGKFSLGVSAPEKKRPSYFDEYNKRLVTQDILDTGTVAFDPEKMRLVSQDVIDSLFYAGARVHMKVELYPLLLDTGDRIGCAVLGLMFAGHGEAFGGGAPVASDADFSGLAKQPADAEDFL